ncbi:MAG: histidinol dehydrogenase [Verrucomicrobia bacterium]|nr:histidinol dehydrogenase [Verrucomicrobiota bacterium]
MNIVRPSDSTYEQTLREIVEASSLFDSEVEERTRKIVQQVADHGDAALLELTQRFDGAALSADQLQVSAAERMTAALTTDEDFRQALELASNNIRAFSRRSRRRNWSSKNAQGATVGEKFDPFQRVGLYIPGGTAPLASTALMTILLAQTAGCREIVVCTPCGRDGSINPALLHAVTASGATEIYKVGGAQAIAAMAQGTATIRKVNKVFGPGNAYVVAAKRLLVGHVAIDLLPGPSEVLVIADQTANPQWIAADLLAQAEHGSGHERVWLVTPHGPLCKAVEKEIRRQLPKLSRRDFAERALFANGWLIQTRTLEEAVSLTNRLAPEHCEIMTRRPHEVAEKVVTAGAIFMGGYSPTVLGDYVAGPSHTLPTGGAGASFAGLTVDQFQRRTSLVEYNRTALQKSLRAVATFARMEGLDAHGRSAAIRLETSAKSKSRKSNRR